MTQPTYKTQPQIWARDILRTNWWHKQVEMALSVAQHSATVVQAGHGVGKTHGCGGIVNWFYENFIPSITLTTAPTWGQVRDLLWAEVAAQRRSASLTRGKLTSFDEGIPLTLRDFAPWTETHYAKGHNARTGEGFQGRHDEHVLIILDEGPGVGDHIWKAADSMLQSELCRILAVGNPTTTSGPYYEALRSPKWHSMRISALDHPNIMLELMGQPPLYPKAVRLFYVQTMIEKHCEALDAADEIDASCIEWPPLTGNYLRPNDEFRIRVLGLSPQKATNAIWAEEWLDKARQNHTVVPPSPRLQVGIDVARFGSDKTVHTARAYQKIKSVQAFQGNSIDETIGRAKMIVGSLCEEYEVAYYDVLIAVDDDGVGGGVTDGLRADNYNVVGVSAATKAAREDRYPNKRSELWFLGATLGRRSELDLTELDEETYQLLRADLLAPVYKVDRRGRRVVEPKDMMRKRLERSPDYADSFNLAACEVYSNEFAGAFRGDSDMGDSFDAFI